MRWKVCKTIFRYCEGLEKSIVKPQFPMTYDLASDPHEDWNLFATKLTDDWVLAPIFRLINVHEQSVKEYRNIHPGEDFNGYTAPS